MKAELKKHRLSIPMVIGLILAITLSATISLAKAGDNPNPGVVPPDEIVFGKTYGQWSAEWWQWALSMRRDAHPLFDKGDCSEGQKGPVWFLGGSFTGESVTRTCTVPSGKHLFFPIVNVECSDVEPDPFFGSTDEERLACAQAFIDDVGKSTLKATIDGVDVRSLPRFRVASPPFNFRMPAQNNILFVGGVTSGRSASDGYWLMLEPPSPGTHVIHFEGAFVSGLFAGFAQNITYNLTVQ